MNEESTIKATEDERWIHGFNAIAQRIEQWADMKGWNEDDPARFIRELKDGINHSDVVHYDLAKHALMVSEIAESMEGRRHGDPKSDKIPEFTAQEEELADCIVRIMHYSAHRKLRIAEALIAKLIYNDSRPYKHGKKA